MVNICCTPDRKEPPQSIFSAWRRRAAHLGKILTRSALEEFSGSFRALFPLSIAQGASVRFALSIWVYVQYHKLTLRVSDAPWMQPYLLTTSFAASNFVAPPAKVCTYPRALTKRSSEEAEFKRRILHHSSLIIPLVLYLGRKKPRKARLRIANKRFGTAING
ncbi:hypothetical protein BDP27DRAFT_1321851 [Rhodocollybia butyracea]|uniref:Uncharacterized protein n=1 Tax=Rhodocollybia butyracea TaxID=206335 RepID=A0A9P5PXJ7_9AGAR|nr:hypothetical protein BDP27DRAFT_1321851 [Rhodocollybia butyracea]